MSVNLGKYKVMVIGSFTKDGFSLRKAFPCGFCGLSVKFNSILGLRCCEWIHGKSTGVKMVTSSFQ